MNEVTNLTDDIGPNALIIKRNNQWVYVKLSAHDLEMGLLTFCRINVIPALEQLGLGEQNPFKV